MIQDTSFVVDVLRGDEDALRRLELIEAESRPQKVAAITVLELYEGVVRSTANGSEQRILDVLDSKHVVDADQAIARKAGKLSGQLVNRGERIDREDCLIAATAMAEDEPVLTRNVDHFDRVEGLDVQSY
ncbi:type II toxin-antitoxin system VapC family toxin [Halococcoides cellulosivorans]|uniref:Ribonuclease VapC n=1 Tax=Halococcoides cellulosivorans TaxID=1679096 RepID=A0A2R4X191_9EURY|nr:type II toxin-antitoxin system VapC family toxin [Halococcoides cellulosivorans]AWB27558.1 VapC toxin family PIN domain ribonuclease [Halococcoides cellulosivorans]